MNFLQVDFLIPEIFYFSYLTYIGCLYQVNCETDFVARNRTFRDMVTKLAEECNSYFDKLPEKEVGVPIIHSSCKKLKKNFLYLCQHCK